MKAITLWQPWASWIAAGWKIIETRTHKRFAGLARQRIAIHAGKKWDAQWFERAGQFLTENQIIATSGFKAVQGVVVCTALVLKHRKLSLRDSNKALCFCGGGPLWGLELTGVHVFRDPPTASGSQGVWFWQEDRETAGKEK